MTAQAPTKTRDRPIDGENIDPGRMIRSTSFGSVKTGDPPRTFETLEQEPWHSENWWVMRDALMALADLEKRYKLVARHEPQDPTYQRGTQRVLAAVHESQRQLRDKTGGHE